MNATNATTKRRRLPLSAAAMALGLFGGPALAEIATDNLAVSATVIDNCTISTAALSFGNYDPIVANVASAKQGTGTVTITCTLDDVVQVTLGQGANADAGSTDASPLRRLNDGGTNYLSYSLFSDAGYSVVWGADATVDVERTGTGAEDVLTVYGSIAGGQNKPAGAYTDTVVATVTF